MSQNITRQLIHAVHDCYTPGHNKRADKFNKAINTDWKIYSLSSRRDMLACAKDFGNFLRENFPEKTRAYYVDKDTIQAYINSKASTCVDKTLSKIISRVWKLEQCCKHTYSGSKSKLNWCAKEVDIPKSTKNDVFEKNIPVPLDVSKSVIVDLQDKRSEVGNAVILSAYAGMRVQETTCLKVKNIHFSSGEFGLGYIEIAKGPEGGAKGGRARVIPIISEEAQSALKSVVAGKKPDDYIAAKSDSSKMTPSNIHRAMREVMDSKHGITYKGNRCHGMRKTWAQMYYDVVRGGGCTRKVAVSKTNVVLGHGKSRGEQGIATYVKRIW